MLSAATEASHPQRRLGLRVPARAWSVFRGGSHGAYAMVVELSATGLVLRFAERRLREAAFRPEQRFGLDLFLPGASAPLRLSVRPVRGLGELEAFEIVEASAVDRLTLAEHLDRLARVERRAHARRNRPRAVSRRSLAGAWKRLLLGPFGVPLARSA
ncbi:MAG TPA: hypothetical protein VMI54_07180 [Polyangiaceae bacterium]|nr:hypothetical protein [Polyangiaceae bacterium]